MALSALSIFLLFSQASCTPIKVDWKALTDFTTTYNVDATGLLAMSEKLQGRPGPIEALHGSGTIQADVIGEKLQMRAHEEARLSGEHPLEVLKGAEVQSKGELLFDGPGGFIAVRAKVSVQKPMPAALEYCVKVSIPKGLLPPPKAIEMKLQQMEPMIDQMLVKMPHKDVTVDGTDVALFSSGPAYVGLRQNGAPFGVGVTPPANGKWTPYIKFTSWKEGAGEITEFSCTPSASTSAAELLADPEAARTLEVFDAMIASLRDSPSMSTVLESFPHSPSLLFQDAASLELSAAKQRAAQAAPSSSLTAIAAVAASAGVVGASVVLMALKMSKKRSSDLKCEALLSSVA